MTRGITPTGPPSRRRLPLLAAACLALIVPGLARADLVVSAQDVTVAPGAAGAGLDVTLTNTGPGAVGIGGFTFELTVGNTAITFTDVTTATTAAPYIFGGLGLFGPSLGIVLTGQDIQAADIFSVIGSGATLGAGATVGLGHLVFNVDPGAGLGFNAVHLVDFPATSLSDFIGTNVPIGRLVDGSITIGRTVPEPASLGLLAAGGAVSFLFVRRRRRPA